MVAPGATTSPTAASAPPAVPAADQIAGLKTYTYTSGQEHVTTPVTYTESPPIGGPHDPEWADCTGTVYSVSIRRENAVHSMEHGATWITYEPSKISSRDLATLTTLVQGRSGLMLSPYARLTSPISVQSWDHQLFVDSAADKRIQQFVDFMTFEDGFYPEVGASCENPTFIDDPLVVGDSSRAAATAAVPTDAPTTPTLGSTVACSYLSDTSGNPNLTDVDTPPNPQATPTQGADTLLMNTGQGDLTLTLDRAGAPCAAASLTYLAQQEFFDGSLCHREVNEATFGVLQCGDPSGTGQGGPTYKFAQEVTDSTTYPRGTIAMANTGQPNSTGSQFFLCFTDTQLSPDYTVVGTVDVAGMAVLDQIAAAGNDGSLDPSPGGGAPEVPVTINTMTVVG